MSWEGRSDRQRLVELLERGRRSAADRPPLPAVDLTPPSAVDPPVPTAVGLARERAADAAPLLVRRLGVAPRAAVVVLALVLFVLAGVVVRQAAGADDGVTPVPVAASRSASSTSSASSGSSGSAAPTASSPPATPGAGPAGTPSGGQAASVPDPPAVQVVVPVVVHVVGQVRRPGIVRLPAGSRVVDALSGAGGPAATADLARVNLARPVVDGEQVVVPAVGEPVTPAVPGAPPAPTAGAGREGTAAVVDLNTADEAALDALPGVGPVLAGRILDRRRTVGPFTSVDELGEVRGIGDTLLEALRPLVRAG